MIQGTLNWQNSLAALNKQPIYQLAIPTYGVTLTSYPSGSAATTPTVRNYYAGGNFFSDPQNLCSGCITSSHRSLVRGAATRIQLSSSLSASPGAPLVATSPALIECGIVYRQVLQPHTSGARKHCDGASEWPGLRYLARSGWVPDQ